MKGEARVFELRELATHLGALEDALARARAGDAAAAEAPRGAIAARLSEASAMLDRAQATFIAASPYGESALDQATVRRRDLGRLVDLAGQRDDDLGSVVRRLASRPFGYAATILAQQAPTWAESMGKRARLRVDGRDVLVPPRLSRVLGGVLAHFVRNAIAHGIEPPAEREQAGKDATGEILLSCSEGGAAGPVIVVEDDGRGLSVGAIVARARELGIDDAHASPANLVFRPGFSTEQEKGELAGLGVGLTAARADLATAGYRVLIEDKASPGARFVVVPVGT
jgi:chemotaxis protein histidine kinase CheA